MAAIVDRDTTIRGVWIADYASGAPAGSESAPIFVSDASERSAIEVPTAATFTRPADTTAYTGATATVAGDLIANSTTAGSFAPMTFAPTAISGTTKEGYVTFIELQIDAAVSTSVRAHIIQGTAPTVTNGDNGVAAISNFTVATYLGFVDLTITPSAAGGGMGGDDSLLIPYSTTGSLYVVLEALTAFTPTSGGTYRCKLGLLRTK